MSLLEKLLSELCPEGVPFKTLGEIGFFYGGLSGKSKEDFRNGNEKFITYMNIYSNIEVSLDIPDRVQIGADEKQNTVEYGDVLFTASSETQDECGISSVLTTQTSEKLYLNSFCFGFRLHDPTLLLPGFSKYLFRSTELRQQLTRTASGVTRFNVSKKKMEKVKIPLPPLPVQREIVQILDNFTLLTAELTAELTARKKQYEYYRDQLLTFDECQNITGGGNRKDVVPIHNLGDLCDIYDGTHQTPRYTDKGIRFVSVENINALYESRKFIAEKDYELNYKVKPQKGDVFMTRIGSIGTCAVIDQDEPLAYYVTLTLIRPKQDVILSRYIKHIIESKWGRKELAKRTLVNATPIKINLGEIGRLRIPVPSLPEQARLVSILDRFDALCNDLTSGLPAEIEARHKQYEYYRDKLLTFQEMDS